MFLEIYPNALTLIHQASAWLDALSRKPVVKCWRRGVDIRFHMLQYCWHRFVTSLQSPSAMPRITVELSIEEHRALKLLTILEGKKLGAVLNEAIHSYLVQKGAHDLEVIGKQ